MVKELFFKDVRSSGKGDSKELSGTATRAGYGMNRDYKVSGLLGIDVSLKGRQGKRDRASVLGWSKGTIKRNNLKEVIIATSATVEGQTTAHYIEDTIKNDKLKITKLAQGLPVGGEIEQLDDGTLFSAFKNRVPVTGN